MVAIDLARLVVAISVLAFAALCDLRWRRAPDACWVLVAATGALLLLVEWLTTPAFFAVYRPALLTSLLVIGLAIVGYLTGLIAGGADAKALASLAVLAPVPLGPGWGVPLASPFPLVLTTLTNGLMIALLVPVVLLAWNLARGDVDGVRTLMAFRAKLDNVRERFVWPLEYVDEQGERVVVSSPRDVPRGAFDRGALARMDQERVWVTPKVPFLVPLWFGLLVAILAGDPVAWIMQALLA